MAKKLNANLIVFIFLLLSFIVNTEIYFHIRPLIAQTVTNNKQGRFKTLIDGAEFFTIIPDTLWQALDSAKNLKGYIFKVWPKGYVGIIPITVGIDTAQRVSGIYIGGPAEGFKETPGLGSRVREKSFLNQFLGKEISKIALKKDGGEIDAVSGATISSRAVCEGIKKGFEQLQPLLFSSGKSDIRQEIFSGARVFEEIIKDTLWYALSGGETLGLVFTGYTLGYLDTIKYLAGINKNGGIERIIITYSHETDGIGEKIREAEFLNKFKTEIPDAISGATISSMALIESIKQNLERFKEYLK
ncbi:MAG: FMN-binding protein [candidate division WOR-3 bacterium]